MNLRLFLSLCLVLALTACNKLTLDNYNKIELGMSYDDVVQHIGSPTKCDDVLSLRHCTWGNDSRSANVTFAGGKVMLFSSSNLN